MKKGKKFSRSTEIAKILFSSILLVANPATANQNQLLEQIDDYSNQNQVNSVSQLRDVSPGDWAYEALRSLVERYGCIAGYPDSTYRGNRAMTRYEFAAGLNACLNQIERLIASSETVLQEDIEILQRLTQEFQAELTTLGARVDNLEGRVALLEENQFSTTTTLNGYVIFAPATVFTGENADGEEIDKVPIFADRIYLDFNTSFTGEDLLFTELAAGNFPEFASVTGTSEGEFSFTQPDDDNDLVLYTLSYYFPIGDRTQVVLEAFGGAAEDFADIINVLYGDGNFGSFTQFGTYQPLYRLLDGSGIGVLTELSDSFELSLGYLANEAGDPTEGSGLFNGPFSAMGQLTFKPGEEDRFKLALTYIYSYNILDTFSGSRLSNFRTFTEEELGEAARTSSNSYGVQTSWQISDRIILGGWAGYTSARILSTLDGIIDRGDLDIWNWAVTLAFPDLGKEGSLGAIVVGMEPKVTDSSVGIADTDTEDEDTSLHVEAFYQYQLTDNIALTPGVVWITAPDHDNDNNDIVIGTIRTTFSF